MAACQPVARCRRSSIAADGTTAKSVCQMSRRFTHHVEVDQGVALRGYFRSLALGLAEGEGSCWLSAPARRLHGLCIRHRGSPCVLARVCAVCKIPPTYHPVEPLLGEQQLLSPLIRTNCGPSAWVKFYNFELLYFFRYCYASTRAKGRHCILYRGPGDLLPEGFERIA